MFWSANITDKVVDSIPSGTDHILLPQKRTFISQITIGTCIILYKPLFVGLLET